jgi:hypothetical protein
MLDRYGFDIDALYSEVIREPAAEMLGTMMLTLVGTAANCQVVLSSNSGVASSPKGDYLSICFGWACSSSLTYIRRFSAQWHQSSRCFPRCLDRWRCLWRPRQPCGMTILPSFPSSSSEHNYTGDFMHGHF